MIQTSNGPPVKLPASEQQRRAAALDKLVSELELDALVLAGADYRGHKGSLRWVADYNLVHRYGFAIAAPGRGPELLLPQNLGQARRGGWDVPMSFARDLRIGLPRGAARARPDAAHRRRRARRR